MIRAVIFDYGRVISWAENRGTTEDVMAAFRVSREEVAAGMKENIGGLRRGEISEFEFWQRMAKGFGREVPEDWSELWRKGFREKLVIDEEMLELVRDLKKKGIKVATITNNIAPFVEIIRERNGYKDFDEVLISCEVGMEKPEPGIYELTLKRLGLEAGEVLFVDDREENIKAAETLGMQTVLAQGKEAVQAAVSKITGC